MRLVSDNHVSTYALSEAYISHHGIKGQKWGVRRYQNSDGSLTEAGKKKYRKFVDGNGGLNERGQKRLSRDLKSLNKRQEKAIKRSSSPYFQYAFSGLTGHSLRRANRKYRQIEKRYGKMGMNVLDQKQIERGKIIAERTFQYTQSQIETARISRNVAAMNRRNQRMLQRRLRP